MTLFRKTSLILALVLALSGTAARPSHASPAPAQKAPADWTILFYMTADTSDIEDAMMLDVNEIESVGSTDQVNLVAQVDRTDADPSWTDTRRFLLEKDGDWDNVNSPVLQSLGEADQGDPAVLVDFMLWGVQNYPASHYALVMSDHGGGWTGFGWDQTNDDDPLTLPELDQAFSQVTAQTGQKLDLIAFDACLMSQLEVMKTLAPYADYAILSEETVPGYGFAYDQTLPKLMSNPAMSAEELGRDLVKDYIYSYSKGEWKDEGEDRYDLSVIALSKISAIDPALSGFVSAVQGHPGDTLKAIGVARNNALTFASDTPDDADSFSSVDFIHFLELLIKKSKDSTVDQAAQNLIDTASQAVAYHEASKALKQSHGISIFFPRNEHVYEDYGGSVDYPQQVPQMATWQTFLSVFYGEAVAAIPPGSVSSADAVSIQAVYPSDTVSIHQPPVITFNTNARHILEVSFSATLQRDDGTQIMLDQSPLESAETSATGEPIVDFPDGLQANEFTWGVEMPVITDGTVSVPTLLISNRQDPNSLGVSGQYTGQDGRTVTAYLNFDLDTQAVTSVWGVLQAVNGGAPFNIHPQPGDTFLPTWRFLDQNGSYKLVPASSKPLTFGSQPFTYHYEPALSGTYVLTIRLEDVAGNVYTSSTTVTVDNEGLDIGSRGYTDIDLGVNFLYPWDWPDPVFENEADGSMQTLLSNPDGTINLYVIAYDSQSDQDIYDAAVEYLDEIDSVDYDESAAEEVTVDGYGGTIIPYTFTLDGEPHVGTLLAVYVPDLETGYLVDLDATDAQRDQGEAVFDTLIGSLNFFTPPSDTSTP